jgi:deoxyribose-phosphate aldolase
MCSAIKYYYSLTGIKIGFKPAGGIRQVKEALEYKLLVEEILGNEWMNSNYFRIGASIGLLQNIQSALLNLP